MDPAVEAVLGEERGLHQFVLQGVGVVRRGKAGDVRIARQRLSSLVLLSQKVLRLLQQAQRLLILLLVVAQLRRQKVLILLRDLQHRRRFVVVCHQLVKAHLRVGESRAQADDLLVLQPRLLAVPLELQRQTLELVVGRVELVGEVVQKAPLVFLHLVSLLHHLRHLRVQIAVLRLQQVDFALQDVEVECERLGV